MEKTGFIELRFLPVILPLLFISCSAGSTSFPGVKSELLLQATHSWEGERYRYPEGDAELSVVHVELEPGAATGWHRHPVPSVGVILQGTLEVTILESGETRRVGAGEAIPEVVQTVHEGRNVGNETVRLLVFYAGAEGVELTLSPP